MAETLYRLYADAEVGDDGYPPEWHETIKHDVRDQVGHRCVRCHHPYRSGEHGNGEWSLCDELCTHGGPLRLWQSQTGWVDVPDPTRPAGLLAEYPTEARWRILTVHHLDGNKANCRWWNLAALCQRCHLQIQGRVQLAHVYPWRHSEWFQPYAAGYYAHAYLGEDLSRVETEARLEELLSLELIA